MAMTSSSNWFHDPAALLNELRREQQGARGTPIVAGYEDLCELRRGGQGVVYTAIQRSTGQRVAIKVLLEGAFASRTGRQRFEREIELVAQMRHPNIVRVYDSGNAADGRLYSVMEYIEGRPLDEWWAERRETLAGPAYVSTALRLFQKVCDAVHYAHLRGVVHRDLKPSNVRVGPDGEPHVLDFGLAKDTTTGGGTHAMTAAGQFMGSLPWASPEQADGFPNGIDVRTDVYSLGVILYQMLTERFPYETTGPIREVLQRIVAAKPVRPGSIDCAIDAELEAILLKCLAKEPERRYQSAGDLAADLRRYLAGEPLEARRDSATYMLRKNLRRYRWPLGIAAAFMILLAAATVTTSVLYSKAEQRSRELARNAYIDRINLASSAYRDTKMGAMRTHLDQCPPDLRDWEWYYLDRLANLSDFVLRGHQEAVTCVAFSPDGKRLASAGRDGMVKLWDADTGRELPALRGHRGFVWAVAFSADGTRILSGGDDGTLRILDSSTGQSIPGPASEHGPIRSLAVSPQGDFIACGHGSAITLWNVTTGEIVPLIEGQQEAVTSLQFSSDGHRLLSGSAEAVILWEVETGQEIRRYPDSPAAESDKISQQAVGFCHNDTRIFAIGPRFVINVWDIASGEALCTLSGHSDTVWSATCSPDGRWLLSAGDDMTIRLWDLETRKVAWILRGHENHVNSVAISADGRRIASGGDDSTVRIWHHPLAENGRDEVGGSVFTVRGCEANAGGGNVFRADGRLFVMGGGFASSWDCRTGEADLLPFVAHATTMAISPDGRVLAYGIGCLDDKALGVKGRIKVFGGAPLNEQRWESDILPDQIYSLAFSPDGQRLVANSADEGADGATHHGLDVFDAATGQRLMPLRGHTREVRSIAFDNAGSRIVSGGADGAIRIWDADGGRELLMWQADEQTVHCVRFSADGRWLASAGGSGACKLWDAATGLQLQIFSGHSGQAFSVAFHPGGRRLVSAGADETAKIWDIETGRELLSLKGDAGAQWAMFSPDGATLVAAGREGTSLQVLETRRPSSDVLAKRQALGEAQRIVDALYEQRLPPNKVTDLLSDDANGLYMSEEVRKAAMGFAAVRGGNPSALDNRSWKIVEHPPRTDLATQEEQERQKTEYQYALGLSEYICGEPGWDNVEYRHTLGVAQYRVGLFNTARKTLTDTNQRRGWPQDLAFLAMSLYQLGCIDEAKARLAEAKEKVKMSAGKHEEHYRFIEEAQTLLDTPQATTQAQ